MRAAGPSSRRAAGFTLVEVLVALGVAAIGLAALAITMTQTVRASAYLREKTLAQWIALNRITETRLAGKVPTDEDMEGDVEYAGQTWRWKLETQRTAVEDIFRLDASVALEESAEDSWPGRATGFMGAALAPRGGLDLNWLGNPNSGPSTPPPPPNEGDETEPPPESPTPQPGDPTT